MPQWNCGYYFTMCRRCGHDLVRPAYGRWHIPRGYRVVWQALPPPSTVAAELVRETILDSPDAAVEAELPIMEVLRDLESEAPEQALPDAAETALPDAAEEALPDSAEEALPDSAETVLPDAAEEALPDPAEEATADAAEAPDLESVDPEAVDEAQDSGDQAVPTTDGEADEPPLTALERSLVADFMEEGAAPSVPGEPARGTAKREGEESRPSPMNRVASSSLGLLRRTKAGVKGTLSASQSHVLGAIVHERRTAETPRRSRAGLVASVAASLLLLTALVVAVREGTYSRVVNSVSGTAPVPRRPTPGVAAYVTASVLNCRSAPATQAPTVKRLVRGDNVIVTARDQNWVSLSHEGRQCWAFLRYFSLTRPL